MKLRKNIFIFIFVLIILLNPLTKSFAKIVGNKIIFGSTISLTGKYSSDALLLKNNHKKIIDNINNNANFKIGGKIYKLDIVYYDNGSNEDRANKLIKRLIQNEGVEFLIGPQNLKLSIEVDDLIRKNQLAIVSSSNALSIYIDAFKKVDSVNVKKIREFILKGK